MKSDVLSLVGLLRSIMSDATTKIALAEDVGDICQAMATRLHFKDREDWLVFGSCLYTLEDSAMAIRAYFSTSRNDYGIDFEYLRLFGFLNACYLQLGAIDTLATITSLHNKNAEVSKLKSHELIQCRHMLASHTLSYIDSGNLRSITIRQCDLGGTGATFEVNETGVRCIYDFRRLFGSWGHDSCSVLGEIIRKFIGTAYKPNPEKQKGYMCALDGLLGDSSGDES